MLRVLMVLEDYGELMFLQTVLKKMGFDVDAIQNPRSFQEHLLRMNPDVLVMTAYGKKVKGFDICKAVKKVRNHPRIILLRTPGQMEDRDPVIDRWLESPLGAISLLDNMAELCGLDKQILQEKFQRLKLTEAEEEQSRVLKIQEIAEPSMEKSTVEAGNFGGGAASPSSVLKPSTMSSAERQSRYEKFLSGDAPEKHGFSIKKVQEQIKALRKEESASDLDELERQRKLFVEHLFKKKA